METALQADGEARPRPNHCNAHALNQRVSAAYAAENRSSPFQRRRATRTANPNLSLFWRFGVLAVSRWELFRELRGATREALSVRVEFPERSGSEEVADRELEDALFFVRQRLDREAPFEAQRTER